MGQVFEINTLEEMCDLMCNNIIPKEYKYCLRCGRKLKNVDARIRGYGNVCWQKQKLDKHKKLF